MEYPVTGNVESLDFLSMILEIPSSGKELKVHEEEKTVELVGETEESESDMEMDTSDEDLDSESEGF